MASERHISWAVLPSAWPASTCRSSLTICSGGYVLVFMVVLSRPSRGRLGLPYHVDQLSGSRPPRPFLLPFLSSLSRPGIAHRSGPPPDTSLSLGGPCARLGCASRHAAACRYARVV